LDHAKDQLNFAIKKQIVDRVKENPNIKVENNGMLVLDSDNETIVSEIYLSDAFKRLGFTERTTDHLIKQTTNIACLFALLEDHKAKTLQLKHYSDAERVVSSIFWDMLFRFCKKGLIDRPSLHRLFREKEH